MFEIAGYQVQEELYASANTLVYRGLRALAENETPPVILKLLREVYPAPERSTWFRREYETLCALNAVEGVIGVESLLVDQGQWLLVFKDCGGRSLLHWIHAGQVGPTLPVADFCALAMRIANIVGHVHQAGIIHRDINPANVIYNPTTGALQLIDFGIAVRDGVQTRGNLTTLEGTLAYMSPEQTGRLNRSVDYRTDFYALGVTFYELLTGALPFSAADPMEMVHAHIAKIPPAPQALRPEIPESLSALVLKLLSKDVDARYQSAEGLVYDLGLCHEQLENRGRVPVFPLGQQDISAHFQIPHKLYGREQEIQALAAVFERVAQGEKEVLTLSGPAGVGKTALVLDAARSVLQRHGYFVAGQFHAAQRNTPYSAIFEALGALMRQILTESHAAIALWRDKFRLAVGPNGQLITDAIPEAALILGAQPELLALPAAETENRFHLTFGNFIRACASPQHPLVIFLDDLQWADPASLQAIPLLMGSLQISGLCLMVAYREEADFVADAARQEMFVALHNAGVPVTQLPLSVLSLPDIVQLVADTLHCAPPHVEPLANLLREKTQGNPFFVRELLLALHQDGEIAFDREARQWQWNLEAIQARQLSQNVVDLVIAKLANLSSAGRQVLTLAACIGQPFAFQTLCALCELSTSEIAASLVQAIHAGVLIPLGQSYQLLTLEVETLPPTLSVACCFAHDRIQQTLYDALPEAQRQALHWRIGEYLWENTAPGGPAEAEREEHLFAIANHLNQGRTPTPTPAQRARLVEINLLAGRKAKAAAAYQIALTYFNQGIAWLAEDAWERDYALALSLHIESAETAYLSTQFAQMEQLTATILAHAQTVLDKLKLYDIKVQAYLAQNQLLKAVETALDAFKLVGIHFPHKPNKVHTLVALLRTWLSLSMKSYADLLQHPLATVPDKIETMRLMTTVAPAAYFVAPNLVPLLVFEGIRLSLRYGYAPVSPFGYASYGLILCGVVGAIDAGYQYGQLALALLERLNVRETRARILFVVNDFTRHWKEHARNTLADFEEAYHVGREVGDFEYAADGAFLYSCFSYLLGSELPTLEREMRAYGASIQALGQERIALVQALYHQVVLNLMGMSATPCLLIGASYDEREMLAFHRQSNDHLAVFYVYFNKLILCYLLGEYAQALEHARNIEPEAARSTFFIPIFYFYETLSLLATYPASGKAEQRAILRKVSTNQRRLKKWARHAPMNCLHKYHLLCAERARVLQQPEKARGHYDNAIALAAKHEYRNDEALSLELTARFYFEQDNPRLAAFYLREAYHAYQHWGATAKLHALEVQYPQFFVSTNTAPPVLSAHITTPHFSTTASRRGTVGALDYISLTKAFQSLSGEILLDKLLVKLMQVVIENAGAQKGYLILRKRRPTQSAEPASLAPTPVSQLWVIEAEAVVNQKTITVLQSQPITEELLPLALIHYVANTQTRVALHAAAHEGPFVHTLYIETQRPQSILCLPLVNQGQLVGMLYLENALTQGAFTPERIEVLDLLAVQAAVSIENAYLYAHLEEVVTERTTELSQANRALQSEISERKQVEETLRQQTLELAARNEELDAFAHTVAHDLKNPLTIVVGYGELLYNRIHRLKTEDRTYYLKVLVQNAHRMTRIINELLLLASVRQLTDVEFAFLDTPSIVQEVLARLDNMVKESQAQVLVPETWPQAYGYAAWVEEVWVNYLSNALKYGGTPPIVELGATEQGDGYVRFWVRDNGHGLTPEEQSRLFTLFTRLDKVRAKGYGLGLSIVQRIVKKLGGQVGVTSQIGGGSTFYFTIPMEKLDEAA